MSTTYHISSEFLDSFTSRLVKDIVVMELIWLAVKKNWNTDFLKGILRINNVSDYIIDKENSPFVKLFNKFIWNVLNR